jgi:metal-responsive CopG/Arc/MetJ family transcriptional regulator
MTVVILFCMKTAISIPDTLFKAAERLADRLGVSRSELYQLAVSKLLAEHEDTATTEALNKLYGEDPEASRLDPALEQVQSESLDAEDW